MTAKFHSGPPATPRRPAPALAGSNVPPVLPTVTPWLLRWFRRVAEGRLRRQFNAVRMGSAPPALRQAGDASPLVLFTNHASWWDPVVLAWVTGRFFPDRRPFAPIAAAALDQYRFFRRLGFFGVEAGSLRGAAGFLRQAQAILEQPGTVLVITPQGKFADVRERPLQFQRGLAELATRVPGCQLLPLAVEYPFWEERLPEVLLHFGPPVECRREATPAQVGAQLESALAHAQDQLAQLAVRRDPADFATLLRGRTGVGGVYDGWRRFRARWRGETFEPRHGRL